ncbi:hypothetical protein Lalb_Chr01g0012521 [Lupinus albus]|uniref:Uncharacterized protein n=1 Tax=Lupinus albus TaxID=3870 RepID=A0A6A4R834_LUPAL|nr:hypothetical protein Lalb_Chr01g0012521 [Lupinus albus]
MKNKIKNNFAKIFFIPLQSNSAKLSFITLSFSVCFHFAFTISVFILRYSVCFHTFWHVVFVFTFKFYIIVFITISHFFSFYCTMFEIHVKITLRIRFDILLHRKYWEYLP